MVVVPYPLSIEPRSRWSYCLAVLNMPSFMPHNKTDIMDIAQWLLLNQYV